MNSTPHLADAARALRQLPKPVAYRPGHVRYWKLPLRDMAFKTQHIAATADARDADGTVFRHRVDGWLCEDVPFGVIRLRLSAADAATHETRAVREFVLTAAGHLEEPDWPAAIAAQLRP